MSNANNNQINIPQAREAMDRFKMQPALEVGVNLTNGCNGHLTSREAGSVGGQMGKEMCPIRISKYEWECKTALGHIQEVKYIASMTLVSGWVSSVWAASVSFVPSQWISWQCSSMTHTSASFS